LIFDLSYATATVIAVAAFVAAIMGGVAGIGTAIVMIPVLTFSLGVREAIPIITVAMMFNNISRWVANRHYINYKVVFWFSLGAVPTAVLGSFAFANAPEELLARGLGIFLLLLVTYRHLPFGQRTSMPLRGFAAVGSVQGFLSAIFGGAGPFGAHFFLTYGLYRNAFIGTAAVATTSINVAKSASYAGFSLLDGNAAAIAVTVGSIMVAGAFVGGILVKHVPDRAFAYIVESVMAISGLTLIVRG
jgi:uncharacterized membrane protein YfcA